MTTLLTDRNTLLQEDPARALIITGMPMQGRSLKEKLLDLGWPAAIAFGPELGLNCLEMGQFDLVVIDVNMGYPAVGTLVDGLRSRHPASRVAIMLGWWDYREQDMRPLSDLLIYMPVYPEQLRQAMELVPQTHGPK